MENILKMFNDYGFKKEIISARYSPRLSETIFTILDEENFLSEMMYSKKWLKKRKQTRLEFDIFGEYDFENSYMLENIYNSIKLYRKPIILNQENIYSLNKKNTLKVFCKKCGKTFYETFQFLMFGSDKRNGCDHNFNPKNYIWTPESRSETSEFLDNQYESFYGLYDENGILKDSRIARELKKYFAKNYFAYTEYPECINPSTGNFLPYDLAISQYNLYIEVQGIEHYEFTPEFHKDKKDFEYQLYRDKIKKDWAVRHGRFLEIDLREVWSTDLAIEIIENKIKSISGRR